MRLSHTRTHLTLVIALALTVAACQDGAAPGGNANSNTNAAGNANTTANTNATNPTATSSPAMNSSGGMNTSGAGSSSSIETREPERYRATVVLTAQAGGEGAGGRAVPPISMEVARDGANRRLAFQIPSLNKQFVFLDKADKRYVIMPDQKQYGELTSDSVGFNVQRTLTPGQIVARLQATPGVERVGEEQRNGRSVTKYRYAGRAATGTAAGQAQSESFIFIDNETGLPLYAEIFAQTQGSVQGMNQGKAIIEMRDITTNVEASVFEVPQDYKQLTAEEMRSQVQGLMQLVQFAVGMMSNQMGGAQAPPTER